MLTFYKDVLSCLIWKCEDQKFYFKLKLLWGTRRLFPVCYLIYIYSALIFYISPVIVYNFFNLWQLWLYMCRAWPRWIKICNTGVLTWAQWVNDPPCLCEGASSIFRSLTHWCGIDHRCGSYLIPGQGTFICCRGSWKRTKEKKKICNTVSVSDYTGKNSRLRPVVEIFILVL